MKVSTLLLCCAALTAMSNHALSQVYRCDLGGGKITYSDQPCADGGKARQVARKRTEQEILDDQMRADIANERKYRARAAEQERYQQNVPQRAQVAQQAAPLSASKECKDAQKDLEYASSIRTGSAAEKRTRANMAIAKVNAACGSNTPLMQEPAKITIKNDAPSGGPIRCDANWCTDSQGNVSPRIR